MRDFLNRSTWLGRGAGRDRVCQISRRWQSRLVLHRIFAAVAWGLGVTWPYKLSWMWRSRHDLHNGATWWA